MVEILPSLLAADFARLDRQIARVEEGGVSMLHLDVMDGHFVPNITFGPPLVASIRKVTRLRLDVHLMIENPDAYIGAFITAGADSISVHQEACRHLDRTLRLIQEEGLPAGVVINPATPVSTLDEAVEIADFVLVMSVNPGFGGQRFLRRSLDKIRRLAEMRERRRLAFRIEIDGGVTADNVADVARAGCDWIVAGSSVFGAEDPAAAARRLRQLAHDAVALKV